MLDVDELVEVVTHLDAQNISKEILFMAGLVK